MGKKKSASASAATKVSRDWGTSTISDREVNKLRTLGLISSSDDDIRLPAFLGIDPHWGLWKKIFYVKRHNDNNPPPPVVGGVGFIVRKEVDYFNFPMKESVQGWRHKCSDDDDDVPLEKRAKLFSGKSELAKESNPSPAEPTPPSRTSVVKIPVSKVIPSGSAPIPPVARDHPIYATVDAVADFADQFTRLESENAHLRKIIKTSADQVLEANKLAADAQNENISLKDEVKKLNQKMKDEQDARREAAIAADEKEGVLRESIANLLMTCANQLLKLVDEAKTKTAPEAAPGSSSAFP
ncbi:hypothetical protein QYE76_063077 [Lolium multiflorum]|uniref:Uncharacterized protein n=1 Tax=Lolium multiflorum TaxID=4521 RepID=A0AAD8W8Z9_LOLMU|nr:hypothetical protein QYE76_063077 [Lolium multiflorum]